MLRNASLSMFVSALAMIACARSHVATPPAANSISIELRPSTVEIRPGDAVKFEAIVTGTANTGAAWSVQESGGGAVDATGRYVAPQALGTYHVVAKSVVDPTVSSIATIVVSATASVAISISPATTSVTTGGTIAFSATGRM